MAKYPGNDTRREIIAFALPASAAKAARDVCEREFFSLSHLCRTALFNDLKARGFDCNDFSRGIAPGAGREDLPR
jgi:hypothetical protein